LTKEKKVLEEIIAKSGNALTLGAGEADATGIQKRLQEIQVGSFVPVLWT
jgi:hypothetical protein